MRWDEGRQKDGKRGNSKKTRGQRFAENIAAGMTQKAAALEAGYSLSVAEHPKQRLWKQQNIQTHFQKVVQRVLPPQRASRVFDELLEAKSVTMQLKQERMADPDGTVSLQVVSAVRTETVDLGVQLRALELAIEHGGLVASSSRAQVISPESLEEVLERSEQEYEKHAAMMTPTWLKERAKRLGTGQ